MLTHVRFSLSADLHLSQMVRSAPEADALASKFFIHKKVGLTSGLVHKAHIPILRETLLVHFPGYKTTISNMNNLITFKALPYHGEADSRS